MPFLTARGETFHVVRLGQGPPLVMVHGLLLGSSASWFFTAAPALAQTHAVLLFDLRGHGRSSRPRQGYGLASMSADLLALAADDAEPLTLVGHSYGALVALRTALDRPERVRRLLLVEAPPEGVGLEDWGLGVDRLAALTPATLVESLPAGMQALVARGGRQARRLVDNVRFLVFETTLPADLRAERGFSERELASLHCPVHLFYGDRSACLPAGERLGAAIPGARLTILPGGHYLHLDAPGPLTERLAEACCG